MNDSQTTQALKAAKQRKGEIAGQFKHLSKDTPEHQEALRAMQAITAEIKQLEAQLQEQAPKPATSAPPRLEQQPPFTRIDPNSHYSGNIQCRLLSPAEWPLWDAYVAQQPQANLYQQGFWAELIERNFGHTSHVWAALGEDGALLGGVFFTAMRSRLFGQFGVSTPYFNYGGVLSAYQNVAVELLQSLQPLCTSQQLGHIEVRCMQDDWLPGGARSDKKVSMVLALPSSQAALDEQLGAKVRAQYKKAQDHQPRFSLGGSELLEDFYRVFAHNMRDLGTPVYSKGWFASLLAHPKLKAQIAVVYMHNRPVSAGFLLGHKGMLEIPWASTLKSANALNANMWLYRQILGAAIEQGYRFFDFGRSTFDAGTYKFKKQWGAKAYPHTWYYLLPPGGQMPGLNPDNPKYRAMIAIWQRLPVWLTRLIGPAVVANLP
jgi:FemAB-related protein (PEP-CTERM system-associated)